MATGGVDIDQAIGNTSETAYEYACTLCIQKKGSYSEATNYCPECDVFYCRPCLQYICDHGSLGKAKMDRWGKPIYKTTGKPCKEHTGNFVQLYCTDDNEVGCHVCISENHQHCSQIKYISRLVYEQDTKHHLKVKQSEIGDIKSELTRFKHNRSLRKNSFESVCIDRRKKMQEFRRKMNDLLDDLEKKSTDNFNQIERKFHDKIEEESERCDHLQSELDLIEKRLQESNGDNILEFILLKQSNNTLEEGRKVVSEIESSDVATLLDFPSDSGMDNCLKCLERLAQLPTPGHEDVKQVNLPYSVRGRKTFNVRDRQDNNTCHIIDMCQIPDGRLFLIDDSNSCIKQINSLYQVCSRLSFSPAPRGVCWTGNDEVAVSLINSTIHFVSVDATIDTGRVFTLKHGCAGIAYSSDNLFVTDIGSKMYVYNMSGKCQREIAFDESLSSSLLSLPYYVRRIGVSPDGYRIYITNPNRNILLTIDRGGKVINTFSPVGSQCLRGICVDSVGNVFVCGCSSNNIIQVESTGARRVADIVQPSAGIVEPYTMCYDKHNARLIVSSWKKDECHSLDLVQCN